jgi:hypothetical protein
MRRIDSGLGGNKSSTGAGRSKTKHNERSRIDETKNPKDGKCPHRRQNHFRVRRPAPRKRQPKCAAGTRHPRTEGDEHNRVEEREIPDFRLMAVRPLSPMSDLHILFLWVPRWLHVHPILSGRAEARTTNWASIWRHNLIFSFGQTIGWA